MGNFRRESPVKGSDPTSTAPVEGREDSALFVEVAATSPLRGPSCHRILGDFRCFLDFVSCEILREQDPERRLFPGASSNGRLNPSLSKE
jgi:hypothetical protein